MTCPSSTYSGGKDSPHTFINWSSRVQGSVGAFFTPNSLADLVNVVQMASSQGHKLHVVGSGWAFEDIAFSPDWMISLDNLKKPIKEVIGFALNDKWETMQKTGPSFLFHVEAGAKVADANDLLAST